MPYFSPEEIQKAREIDLLSYLELNEPNELVHVSNNTYTIQEHDSLRINNGKWYWFSQGIGSNSALDFLIHVRGYSFTEAVFMILKKEGRYKSLIHHNSRRALTNQEKIDRLILPKKNENNSKVREYLKKRCIDIDIIDECIDKGFIYESFFNHNVVFVGYDEEKNPRYAFIRATNSSRFMLDAKGSDKAYSFRLESYNQSNSLHIFESAIDLLSYATLLKLNGKAWYNENLLSLAGVYQPASKITDSKLPIAIKNYLDNHKNINKIFIHFDNDQVGKLATKALTMKLENYTVIDLHSPYKKDWNDYLIEYVNKTKNKEREAR